MVISIEVCLIHNNGFQNEKKYIMILGQNTPGSIWDTSTELQVCVLHGRPPAIGQLPTGNAGGPILGWSAPEFHAKRVEQWLKALPKVVRDVVAAHAGDAVTTCIVKELF